MRKFTFRWLLSLLMITSLTFVSNAQYFTEDFETGEIPTGWTLTNGTDDWAIDSGDSYGPGAAQEGDYCIFFNDYDYASGVEAEAITPSIDLTGATVPVLKFWYWDSGGSDVVEVLASTDGVTYNNIYTTGGTVNPWTEITVNLFEFTDETTLTISFKGHSVYGSNNPHIDNIIIEEGPSCPNPSDLTATNITANTADLGWTIGNTETAWNLKVSTTEIDAATEAGDFFDGAATANPHPISGLNADSDYYYYVQANCGTDDLSEWVGPFAFSTLVSCPAPTSLEVADITQTTALLKWVSGGASNYNLFYGPADFVMTEGTEVLLEDTFLLVSDLISATEYEFYVQDSCADGDASVWVGPFAFTTECGLLTAQHAENFDGVSTPNLPICWNSITSSTSVSVKTSSSYASSGSNSVYLYNSWISDGSILLISPEYSDLSSQLNRIRFKARMDGSGIEVGTITDPTDASTFTLLETIPENGGTWEQYVVNLDTYIGSDLYIAFRHSNDATYDYIYIDDYSYEAIPSCFMPSALNVNNITGTSADLAWTTGGAAEWDIQYDVAGFIPSETPSIENTSDNPYSLGGLTPQTDYEFYVRDDCSSDNSDASQWVGPFAFKTDCATNFTLPFTENFEAGFENFMNTDGNDDDFTLETTIIKEGINSIHNIYSANSTNVLITQCNVDLTGNNNPQLSFWHIAKTEGGYDECYVRISVDGGAFVDLPASAYEGNGDYDDEYFHEDSYSEWGTSDISPDNTWWKKETFNLTAYNTFSNVKIQFILEADGSAQRAGWYIDDITIQNITCPKPTSQGVANVTFDTADLTWLNNESSAWNVEYGIEGFVMGTGTTIAVTDTFASISSLDAETDYSFYVQTDCGSSQSIWEGPFDFTTTVTCVVPTELTVEEYTATTATFSWVTGYASNWNIEYGEENFVQGTGTFMELDEMSYTMEGLTPETTYEFYVQDSCGNGDESLWVGPISVTTTASCALPTALNVYTTDVSAALSWEGYFVTNWDIEWGIEGFTQGDGTIINDTPDNPITLTELTESTSYEFYVRADCGSDDTDVSPWVGPYTFTTTCAAFTTFPLFEGFESETFAPECWLNNTWAQSTYGAPYEGSEFAYSNTAGSELITPELALPSTGDFSLTYMYRVESSGYPQDFDVLLSTDGINFDVTIQSVTAYTDDSYQQTSFNLSSYNDQSVWIKFVGLTGTGGFAYGVLIDDVQIRESYTGTDILTFGFTEQTDVAVINDVDHTVEIYVDYGTDMTDITPAFTMSIGAQTDQITTNFTNPVIYSIVAENNDVQDWTVTVLETAPATDNDFLTFSFAEETTTETIINPTDHTIAIEVGNGTLPAALVATFSISQYATINVAGTDQVSGTTANAFVYGTAFEYTIVAQNEDIQIWEVTVTEAPIFTEALFFAYSFEHQASPAVIDNDAKTISVDIQPCVDLTTLVASFELSYNATTSIGGEAQESGVTANDFTLPVIDTVTAEDGTTYGIYTVTVNQLEEIVSDYPYTEDFEGNFLPYCWTKEIPDASSNNDITHSNTENHTEEGEYAARLSSYSYNSSSNYNQYLITETFTIDPMYSEVSFWHRKSNSSAEQLYFGIATATDTSWTTINLVEDEWNQTFADLSMYNGQDIFFIFHYNAGGSYYYVYVDDLTIKQSGNTDITVYDVPGQLGTTEIVSESDSIQVMMPFGTAWPVTFAADFELMSATTAVDGAEQASTVTENTWVDNTTPVVYTVTAQDGTTKEWSVYVDVALNPAKEILTYSIAGEDVDAVIDAVAAEIHVTLPLGTTDFADLVATFTISDDATVAIAGEAQVSTVTLNTWTTAPLVYTVTAQDGTTKDWSVFVAAALNFENEILTFSIDGQESATTPDPANPVIDIVMPAGTTDLSGLIATFTLSDAATANVGTNLQVSEVTSNNWSTGTVVYDVIAENGTVKEWTINVTVAPFSGTEFISYVISGQDGLTDIITENDSIHIYMLPTVENITDRVATFELSEGATAVVNGMDQVSGDTENDFSNSGVTPVIYTVTAGDGTVREWKVVVDLTVGINEIVESKDIQVYPNPNNGLFELAINIANLETVNLEVVNTQGQLVSTFNDVNTKIAQSLDLSELATGVYYIKVITEKETLVKKVNILK